ncbi:membrane dipeptidase [Janthinobacterium sp. PSPC3-1]|uniref:membrane dipeptidase n=1 Tax=Janthinobacterium sp. PSPC3-1 TaxID=2804653 RepID=UPI003CF2E66F
MQAQAIYQRAIVFDGLNICNWSREIFEQWQRGGITGVSATCGLWEGFRESIANVVQWKKWFEEHSDLILQATSVNDIRRAKREGKTAVLLSWQNTSGIEDKLDYLRVFRDLGVRKMQLTYNTQNYSGAGYVEANDSGLTGFGREVVSEMGKLGIVCDLSHVGAKTSLDVIEYATVPPCFSHILPAGMKDIKRNKSDALISELGRRGGIIGLSQFGPFMQKGNDSTIDDYVAALDYVIELAGEDHVGIGSDASQGHARPSEFLEWCNHDKGYARELTPFGHAKVVKPLGPLEQRPLLADAMQRAGWSEEKMVKVLGENWLNYLERVWQAP